MSAQSSFFNTTPLLSTNSCAKVNDSWQLTRSVIYTAKSTRFANTTSLCRRHEQSLNASVSGYNTGDLQDLLYYVANDENGVHMRLKRSPQTGQTECEKNRRVIRCLSTLESGGRNTLRRSTAAATSSSEQGAFRRSASHYRKWQC